MAVKIRLTKNELKRQKDVLKRLQRYLPTLILKKQQLLAEIRRIQDKMEAVKEERSRYEEGVKRWAGVFAEPVDVASLFSVKEVVTSLSNIAGIDIPVFEDVTFTRTEYDLIETPFWVDQGIRAAEFVAALVAEMGVLHRQQEIIKEELRVTVQRINLFEKIKIPETKEAIRKVRIFLGDVQTAEVVRGKISKANLERKNAQGGAQ
jgi:V/A-type H+-transporting ATPase subunit D